MTVNDIISSGQPVTSARVQCATCESDMIGIGEVAAGMLLMRRYVRGSGPCHTARGTGQDQAVSFAPPSAVTVSEILESGESIQSAHLKCTDCPRQEIGIGDDTARMVLIAAAKCEELGHSIKVVIPTDVYQLHPLMARPPVRRDL